MDRTDLECQHRLYKAVTRLQHGYAETMARRLQAMGANGYDNGFDLSLMPDRLDRPRRRKKPTLWFVNSMSDLFHELIPDTYLDQVFTVIDGTPWHTYQILTKRAERMRDYFENRSVPANTWLGVTVEDRQHGFPRLEALRRIAAGVRFISAEPLLEDLEGLELTGIGQVIERHITDTRNIFPDNKPFPDCIDCIPANR